LNYKKLTDTNKMEYEKYDFSFNYDRYGIVSPCPDNSKAG